MPKFSAWSTTRCRSAGRSNDYYYGYYSYYHKQELTGKEGVNVGNGASGGRAKSQEWEGSADAGERHDAFPHRNADGSAAETRQIVRFVQRGQRDKHDMNLRTRKSAACGCPARRWGWFASAVSRRGRHERMTPRDARANALDPRITGFGIDDIVSITSPGHEDITQDTTVLPDGFIHISGLTRPDLRGRADACKEVKAKIFKGLDRLYNNLELSVKIKEATSQYVIILGSRKSPGRYPAAPAYANFHADGAKWRPSRQTEIRGGASHPR